MPERRFSSFPLRLSATARAQAEEFAKEEGVSLNQFIALAVAEKLGRLEHRRWLAEEQRAKMAGLISARGASDDEQVSS